MIKFNLSKRIRLAKNQKPFPDWYHEAIIVKDIKEFIKREFSLIELLNNREINWREFLEKRNNLLGKKLK